MCLFVGMGLLACGLGLLRNRLSYVSTFIARMQAAWMKLGPRLSGLAWKALCWGKYRQPGAECQDSRAGRPDGHQGMTAGLSIGTDCRRSR